MELKQDNFDDKLAFGKDGEKEAALLLLNKGYSVLPLYQFENLVSPKIISTIKTFISPDLTVFKKGKAIFIEVKRKNQWVEHKGALETGCDYRHYLHYKSLSELTEVELWMIFIQEANERKQPVGIFTVSINEEGRHWDGKTPQGKLVSKPMYFWNYDVMTKID